MDFNHLAPQCGTRLFMATTLLTACGVAEEGYDQIAQAQDAIIAGTEVSAANSGVLNLGDCSANLVNNSYLITAKHCLLAAGRTVTMGPQNALVDWVLDHPSLDISIGRLSTPMSMNGSTQGFNLDLRRTPPVVSETVTCRGYGLNTMTSGFGVLREARLQVSALDDTEVQLNRNAAGQVAWLGDSGSTCLDARGRSIGVLSWGSFTEKEVEYARYVRSDVIADWVRQNIYGVPVMHNSSGKCIHPKGGAAFPENGTAAVLWSGCTSNPRINLEIDASGSLRHGASGKCLHPQGGNSNPPNGTPLVFHDGCGAERLRFEVTVGGSLRHVASGKCVHPQGGSSTPGDGTSLVLWSSCDEERLRFTTPLNTGRLRHSSGHCVHPEGGSATPSDGTESVLWDSCSRDDRLRFRHLSSGSIQQVSSGKCLHPSGGSSSPTNGTKLVFWGGCNAERLRFERTASGSLKHVLSGKCLHPQGGSETPAIGTDLVLWDGCTDRRLRFDSVDF